MHHQGRRPFRRCGNVDRRGLRHTQVHHRRNGGELRNDHARNARLRVLCIRGQRRYRSRQRRRLGHGEHGTYNVPVACVHELLYDAKAVRRQGRSAACGGRAAVCLHARQCAVGFREHYHHARFRRLYGREHPCRKARAGKRGDRRAPEHRRQERCDKHRQVRPRRCRHRPRRAAAYR